MASTSTDILSILLSLSSWASLKNWFQKSVSFSLSPLGTKILSMIGAFRSNLSFWNYWLNFLRVSSSISVSYSLLSTISPLVLATIYSKIFFNTTCLSFFSGFAGLAYSMSGDFEVGLFTFLLGLLVLKKCSSSGSSSISTVLNRVL